MYFSSLQKWDVQTSDRFVRESICCQIFAKRIYARDNPSLEAASSSLLLHIYIYTYSRTQSDRIHIPLIMTVLREMVANNIHQQINKIFSPVLVQYSVRLFAPSIKTNYNPLHKVFFLSKCIATLQIRMRISIKLRDPDLFDASSIRVCFLNLLKQLQFVEKFFF